MDFSWCDNSQGGLSRNWWSAARPGPPLDTVWRGTSRIREQLVGEGTGREVGDGRVGKTFWLLGSFQTS